MARADRCLLCQVDMTSLIVATSHYEGKNHGKKVKEWCLQSGLDPPRRTDGTDNVADTWCDYCKISLTSTAMAKSHYSGQQHRKRVESGREKIVVKEDPTGNFGIGEKFRRFSKNNVKEDGDEVVMKALRKNAMEDDLGWQITEKEKLAAKLNENTSMGSTLVKKGVLSCNICDVTVQSKDVLDAHLMGKQHKKKLAQSKNPGAKFRCDLCNIETSDQTGLDMHLQGSKHKKKLKNQ